MDPIATVMKYYPYVFHPGIMVGGGIILLIYTEWRRQDAGRDALRKRVGLLAAVGTLSLLPSLAYMLVTGQGPMETMQGNAWQVDFLVGSGVALVAATLWVAWNRFDWGQIVPTGMEALVAVIVPYVGLSPVWNFSGHVALSVMPTLALVLVDRRWWPLLLIPLVMVPNRVYLDAHTWAQSIGAFLITAVLVVVVFQRRLGSADVTPTGTAAD